MSDSQSRSSIFLNTLPPQVRRNHDLNIALIRADIVLAFTMLIFFMTVLHTAISLVLPIAAFIANSVNVWIKTRSAPRAALSPLPSDIKARIGKIVEIPKRTIFRRGPGNDCASVSFFFFHIVLLPQGFEKDLEHPNKSAILLHEFSHDKFFDYLVLFWIIYTCGLFSYALFLLAAEYLGYMNPADISWEVQPRNEFYSTIFPFAILVALTMLNATGIFYRKEHNADFGAYLQEPELYSAFLRNRIAKAQYYKRRSFSPYVWAINKLSHPPISDRLDFLTGRKLMEKESFILSAVIFGVCPGLIAFSVAVGFTALFEYSTITSILSVPFGVISIIYCGLFLRDVFEKHALTTRLEKLLIWIFMLVGSQLFLIAFMTMLRMNFGTHPAQMAVNSETLIYEFKIYCFCVFFGYLQFAFYLWICSRLTGTFFAGPLALPVFGVVGYSVIYALSAVGSINLQAAILFVILSLFIPPVIAALFEYFIRLLIVLFAPATSKQVKAA